VGVVHPKYSSRDNAQVRESVFSPGFNRLSKLSEGQARQLKVFEVWLMWVRGFVRVGHEAD